MKCVYVEGRQQYVIKHTVGKYLKINDSLRSFVNFSIYKINAGSLLFVRLNAPVNCLHRFYRPCFFINDVLGNGSFKMKIKLNSNNDQCSITDCHFKYNILQRYYRNSTPYRFHFQSLTSSSNIFAVIFSTDSNPTKGHYHAHC